MRSETTHHIYIRELRPFLLVSCLHAVASPILPSFDTGYDDVMTHTTHFLRRDPADVKPWAETCGQIRCLVEEKDGAAAEVRPQVGAVRVHDGNLAVGGSISHQLPAQHTLGERLVVKLAARAEEIPGGRILWKRFRRWALNGVFEKVFKALSGEPDLEYALIDGTIVKVHRHSTGAKWGLKIRPSANRAAA